MLSAKTEFSHPLGPATFHLSVYPFNPITGFGPKLAAKGFTPPAIKLQVRFQEGAEKEPQISAFESMKPVFETLKARLQEEGFKIVRGDRHFALKDADMVDIDAGKPAGSQWFVRSPTYFIRVDGRPRETLKAVEKLVKALQPPGAEGAHVETDSLAVLDEVTVPGGNGDTTELTDQYKKERARIAESVEVIFGNDPATHRQFLINLISAECLNREMTDSLPQIAARIDAISRTTLLGQRPKLMVDLALELSRPDFLEFIS